MPGESAENAELSFLGEITTSAAHDLNNVVSVIEQTAGLLEDLLLPEAEGAAVSKEQLENIVEKLNRQTRRGAAIIKRLKNLAHDAGEPGREFDAAAALVTAAALSQRLAERRKIVLDARLSEAPVAVRGSAFRFQQALYAALRRMISGAPEGSTLTLRVEKSGDGAAVSVTGTPGAPLEKDEFRFP
ncbi:MAG: hypothetical protein ABIJ96_17720 [Elusimicrobiota bacterium]